MKKAIITSVSGKFEQYEITNVVSITYLNMSIDITYIDKRNNTIQNAIYNSNDIIVRFA